MSWSAIYVNGDFSINDFVDYSRLLCKYDTISLFLFCLFVCLFIYCLFIFVPQDLQDQLSTSDLVSADIQQVFGRQLLVLQQQRDSLLGELEEQKKERCSFVDIIEEKHALEENLRSGKEQLADKLRQKEMLESQLEHERATLQEQLIRQARLNEIIREKDVLEEELIEQKNRLQVHKNLFSGEKEVKWEKK